MSKPITWVGIDDDKMNLTVAVLRGSRQKEGNGAVAGPAAQRPARDALTENLLGGLALQEIIEVFVGGIARVTQLLGRMANQQ